MTIRPFIVALVSASALFGAAPALAQSNGLYVNGGATLFDADRVELTGLTGRLGYHFTPFVGAEGELSLGVGDDSGVELDSALSAFGVARWPFAERFDAFARAGVTRVEVTGGDDEGFAFGVGGHYWLTPVDGLRLDLTRHMVDDAGGDIDAISLAYARRF